MRPPSICVPSHRCIVTAPPDPDAEEADDPEEGDDMAAMRRTVLSMFSPPSAELLSAAELDLLAAENLMSRQNGETLSADYQAADWRPMLPTITVPMLAIWLSACRGMVLKLLDGHV